MSGYLANLLAHSRGTAPAIRPRTAALFEPVGTSPGASGIDIEREETDLDLADTAPPADRRLEDREISEVEALAELPQPVQSEQKIERGEPRRPAEAEPSARISPSARLPVSANPRPKPARPEAQPPAAPPQAMTARATPPLIQKRVPPVERATPTQPPAREPKAPPLPLPSTPPPAAIRPEPPAPVLAPPPRRPRMPSIPSLQKSVSAEPTINVTIGRIEVRAVSQPPPRQKERTQPAVMSLNDYLKSRAGGSRP